MLGASLGGSSSLDHQAMTHRLFLVSDAIQRDNVGMPELCHNGRLLKEFDFVSTFDIFLVERLHSHIYRFVAIYPYPLLYLTKIA